MRIRRSIMAIGLAACTACLPLLGANGAILNPMAGKVMVNGHNAIAGFSLATGDTVATSSDGSARLSLAGGTLIAASKTNFKLENASNATEVRLNSGEVKVSGNLVVAFNSRSVVPASSKVSYNAYAMPNGTAYVEAVSGNINVIAGDKSYTVHAGEAVKFDNQNTPAAAGSSSAADGTTWPVTIGVAAAAAVVSSIVVYEETKCSNCVSSPSQ